MGISSRRQRAQVFTPGHGAATRTETIAVEEPLQIQVNGTDYAMTMRTPGHDVDLALGFLFSEGVITSGEQVARALNCPDDSDRNTVSVHLRAGVPAPQGNNRLVNSACGVCGTDTVADVVNRVSAIHGDRSATDSDWTVGASVLAGLPEQLLSRQKLFANTGGVHAAGLFDDRGAVLVVREDVGRHNALDKVIGDCLVQDRIPVQNLILQVSGRLSYELVQKAAMAGCGMLAAVSAPSSLAIELAEATGITLIGFSRGERFTAYTHPSRIVA